MRFGIEGFMEGLVTEIGRLSRATLRTLRNTPSSALGSCRYKLMDSDLPRVFDRMKELEIGYFFLIGGNDTMDTIQRISAYCETQGYALCGIGVPKTVDNDLYGTDHTPGYGSAARYVALSVLQAGRLARDMRRVDSYTIFQTVGREAGWLAAAAAAARHSAEDAPHLVYVPERRISKEQLLADVGRRIGAQGSHGWCYIVVGEGLLWKDGTPVSSPDSSLQTEDRFGNVEFGAMGGGSVAMNLHRLIHAETGLRGEFQITESLSMCADDRVSHTDRDEAWDCGAYAVRLASRGESGVMAAIERAGGSPYQVNYGSVPLADVAERAKPMPANYLESDSPFPSRAFLDYLQPLIGKLPHYTTIDTIINE